MSRIIFFGLLAWAAVYFFKRKMAARAQKNQNDSQQAQDAYRLMVQCPTCGLHVPKSESFQQGNHHYCCESHIQ